MAALSFTAQNYIQTGNSSGVPSLTSGDAVHAGAQYFDTGTTRARVYNGTSWLNLTTGDPIVSINTLTATALTLAGTTNEIILTPSGGNTITFSTPQAINTAANVNFGTVTTTGAIQSGASGAAIAFQTSSPFNFQVDGNGNLSAAGSFNATGGSSAYKMGGSTVIDVNRVASLASVATYTPSGYGVQDNSPAGSYFTKLSVGTGGCPSCSPSTVSQPARALGVTYQNTSYNPRVVTVSYNHNSITSSTSCFLSTASPAWTGFNVAQTGPYPTASSNSTVSFIVPPAYYYLCSAGAGISINSWTEWQ
jgi:hypothetical protein